MKPETKKENIRDYASVEQFSLKSGKITAKLNIKIQDRLERK